MNGKSTPAGWTALLLGLPLLAVALGVPTGAPQAREATAAEPPAPPAAAPDLPANLEPCADRVRSVAGRGYDVRYLVATLPDPADSLYGRLFDLHVASIRRAMEGLDYLEDGSCLPWPVPGEKAEAGPDGAPLYRGQPGALLFRHDGEAAVPMLRALSQAPVGAAESGPTAVPTLTVVLLVGESPPWGVHPLALERALDYACLGRGWPAGAGAPRLLAPTFSASTASLGVALRDWFAGGPTPEDRRQRKSCVAGGLDLVSGTATGTANHSTLAAVLPSDLEWSYRSAATANDALKNCMMEYFLPRRLGIATGGKAPQKPAAEGSPVEVGGASARASVALLVESSVYGQDFRGGRVLTLPFPMHVSSLRTEYEAQKAALARAAAKGGGGDLERSFLALAASEERRARDTTRVFDLVGTTRSQDLELAGILSVVARERLQAVGIIATNVRDTLFLAEALRRYAPDVRLFTFEGDLLLAHPDYGAATRGMIVVSSNPLLDPDPVAEKNGGAEVRLKFSTDTAQGVYEAARFLAGGSAELPPHEVWFSVVGNARLAPLKKITLKPGKEASCVDAAPTQDHTLGQRLSSLPRRLANLCDPHHAARPPRGWSFVLSLMTALVLALGVRVTYSLARGGAAVGGLVSRDLVWFAAPGAEPLPPGAQRLRHAFLVLIPLATALPYLVLSGPVFFTRTHCGLRLLGVVGLLALAAAVALLLWGLLRRTRHDLRGEGPTRPALARRLLTLAPLAFALLLAGIVSSVGLVALAYLPENSGALAVVLDRLIAFGSGVSPLLPCLLFLAVLTGWVVLTLWRYRTLELLPQPEHLGRAWPHLSGRLQQGLLALRSAVDPAGFVSRRLLTPGHLVLWSLLVLAPVLYLSFYYEGLPGLLMHGVEGLVFDAIVSGLFFLGLVAAVASGLALWQGWVGLRRVMSCLLELRFAPSAADGAGSGEPEAPRWLAPLKAEGKPGPDAARLVVERRNAAYERLWAALNAQSGEAAGDLAATLAGRPAEAAKARPSDFALAWLAAADWAAGRAAPEAGPGEAAASPLLAPAREFFAWQTALLSREASAQLVKLLSFMTFGLLGLWMGVSVYPFEPERVLSFLVGGLIAAAVAVTVAFVVQAEKDPLLSLLAGTQANQINWHRTFLQRLGLYAGLPLLSLLTGRFPEVQRLLQQAIEPLFKVLL